jgi:hypothetical protein
MSAGGGGAMSAGGGPPMSTGGGGPMSAGGGPPMSTGGGGPMSAGGGPPMSTGGGGPMSAGGGPPMSTGGGVPRSSSTPPMSTGGPPSPLPRSMGGSIPASASADRSSVQTFATQTSPGWHCAERTQGDPAATSDASPEQAGETTEKRTPTAPPKRARGPKLQACMVDHFTCGSVARSERSAQCLALGHGRERRGTRTRPVPDRNAAEKPQKPRSAAIDTGFPRLLPFVVPAWAAARARVTTATTASDGTARSAGGDGRTIPETIRRDRR